MKRGNFHKYLGMDTHFSEQGFVDVSMIKYLKKIIEAFTEEINSTSKLPASDHLFQIREESEAMFLPEEKSAAFHHMVYQILFMSARAIRDIQISMEF